ncbi:hypothetical protein ACKI1H_08045 [Pseudomonas sp. YH-1]|jgi:hypothetical protein|uniref:hypothetical protein n=1 Tax=Pseudomonas sp. YH-1 TaxID=3384787 RepID=UPI003F7D05B3
MRYMALLVGALFVSGAAQANELCDKVASTAREVMKDRQNGVPIDSIMAQLDKRPGDSSELIRQMVLTAYERDRRYSEKSKERDIVEFGNEMYLHCSKLK